MADVILASEDPFKAPRNITGKRIYSAVIYGKNIITCRLPFSAGFSETNPTVRKRYPFN